MVMVAVEPTLPEVSDFSPTTVGQTLSTQPVALTAVGISAIASIKIRPT
jgi:hypothetical protein